MNNFGNITQTQYENFRNQALNHGIVRKTVNFSEIKLVSNTIIQYKGTNFEMTESAFKSLIKFSGLSNAQMEKINSTLGEETGQKFLKLMQTALASMPGKNTLCMLINKTSLKIVNFARSAQGVLSNAAYFNLFEDVMNNHAGMQIKNMAITQEGNIEISVLNNNWEFDVAGLSDEYFKSGLVFINTPDATIINPFNERLVCTNGMIATESGLSLILKNSDAAHVNGFFDAVRNLKGVMNFEQEFKKRVMNMMNSVASYDEVKKVRTKVEYEVANTTDPDVRASIESFIPLMHIESAFLMRGHRLSEVDKKYWKKIRTDMTVWDLVNGLTDLSSHPQRYRLSLRNGNASVFSLQKTAGELAFKEMYDLESPIEQIF
jgi:hypothetical protein